MLTFSAGETSQRFLGIKLKFSKIFYWDRVEVFHSWSFRGWKLSQIFSRGVFNARRFIKKLKFVKFLQNTYRKFCASLASWQSWVYKLSSKQNFSHKLFDHAKNLSSENSNSNLQKVCEVSNIFSEQSWSFLAGEVEKFPKISRNKVCEISPTISSEVLCARKVFTTRIFLRTFCPSTNSSHSNFLPRHKYFLGSFCADEKLWYARTFIPEQTVTENVREEIISTDSWSFESLNKVNLLNFINWKFLVNGADQFVHHRVADEVRHTFERGIVDGAVMVDVIRAQSGFSFLFASTATNRQRR